MSSSRQQQALLPSVQAQKPPTDVTVDELEPGRLLS
ncbi:hypothetical protein BH18ACI2_BH18ACI2_21450 [soil metagenome]